MDFRHGLIKALGGGLGSAFLVCQLCLHVLDLLLVLGAEKMGVLVPIRCQGCWEGGNLGATPCRVGEWKESPGASRTHASTQQGSLPGLKAPGWQVGRALVLVRGLVFVGRHLEQ